MTVIEVKNIHKRYGSHRVVEDITFTVERGEIFGLVGPNGAGKTTIVESIAGLRDLDEGSIRIAGLDPSKDHALLHARLGIQLQTSLLPDKLKVWEALDLYSSFYEQSANWEQLLDDLGLSEKRTAAYEQLSGGQKQRLSIALAMVGRPEILILDELTTGLDPHARREIWQLIANLRQQGVTILLVTHFMEEAERLCDRLAVIDAGRLVALDTPAGIVARLAVKQRMRFRPSVNLDSRLLQGLPEVSRVSQSGEMVEVEGTGELVQAVTSVLIRSQIIAHDLRVESPGLDDAFLALTGEVRTDAPEGGTG